MKDRNVEYPNRYQLNKVTGTDDIYDLVPAPGEVHDEGTILNKGNLLSDTTAANLGFASTDDPTIDDAFQNVYRIGDLRLSARNDLGNNWVLADGSVAPFGIRSILPDCTPANISQCNPNLSSLISVAGSANILDILFVDGIWYILTGQIVGTIKIYTSHDDCVSFELYKSVDIKSHFLANANSSSSTLPNKGSYIGVSYSVIMADKVIYFSPEQVVIRFCYVNVSTTSQTDRYKSDFLLEVNLNSAEMSEEEIQPHLPTISSDLTPTILGTYEIIHNSNGYFLPLCWFGISANTSSNTRYRTGVMVFYGDNINNIFSNVVKYDYIYQSSAIVSNTQNYYGMMCSELENYISINHYVSENSPPCHVVFFNTNTKAFCVKYCATSKATIIFNYISEENAIMWLDYYNYSAGSSSGGYIYRYKLDEYEAGNIGIIAPKASALFNPGCDFGMYKLYKSGDSYNYIKTGIDSINIYYNKSTGSMGVPDVPSFNFTINVSDLSVTALIYHNLYFAEGESYTSCGANNPITHTSVTALKNNYIIKDSDTTTIGYNLVIWAKKLPYVVSNASGCGYYIKVK